MHLVLVQLFSYICELLLLMYSQCGFNMEYLFVLGFFKADN